MATREENIIRNKDNYSLRWQTIERYTTSHIDTKCKACDARIYEGIFCTKCQFDKLSVVQQNRIHEISDAIDLAELKLAVKGISASESRHFVS